MTNHQHVAILLLPAALLTKEDVDFLTNNVGTLRKVVTSKLFLKSANNLHLKQQVDGTVLPDRDYIEEVVSDAAQFLLS